MPNDRLKSVGTRFSIAAVVVLVLCTLLVAKALIRQQHDGLWAAKERAGRMLVQLFAAGASTPLVFEDQDGLATELSNLLENSEVISASIAPITDGQLGEPVAGFQVEGYPGEMHTAGLLEGPQVVTYAEKMAFAMPVLDGDQVVGQVIVEFSLDTENASLTHITRSIIIVSVAVALFVVLVLSFTAQQTIVRPLSRLLNAANQLERGEEVAERDLANNSVDEVGQLSAGFRKMVQAIHSREEQIAERNLLLDERNQDMRLVLDHVSQGFVTLDREGTLARERSAVITTWFPESTEATDFWQLLAPYASENFVEGHRLAWESLIDGFLPLELNISQLPSNFVFQGTSYSIDYTPIPNSEAFTRILVVINDRTTALDAERADMHQREILTAFQHVIKDRLSFMHYYQDTEAAITCLDDMESLSTLKREIHTIKGNSGQYGFSSISERCHQVEDAMDERQGAPTSAELQWIQDEWEGLSKRLAPIIRADVDSGIQLSTDEHAALLGAIRSRSPWDKLALTVASWTHPPVRKELLRMAEQASALAERLGKPELKVCVEGGDFRVDTITWASLWSSFSHIIRNAIDHGIEDSDERAALGKDARPLLSLRALETEQGVTIEIADNGRGINWDVVRELAKGKGLDCETPADLEAALFADGFTTREEVTLTSGRGVGMAAVKQSLTMLGGESHVQSEIGNGTTFRFFIPTAGSRQSQGMRAAR